MKIPRYEVSNLTDSERDLLTVETATTGEASFAKSGEFPDLLALVLLKYAPSLPDAERAALRGALDELYCVVAAGAYTHGREEWTDQPVTIP